MRNHVVAFLTAGALSVMLASCDSFAVLGQFQRGSPLSLTLQNASVQQGATTSLYPSGGTPAYSFGVVAGNLYYPGTLGSISGQVYTAGDAIGTVIIHLSDSSGAAVDAVVTIIPPAPTSFNVQANPGNPSNDILVSWSYTNTALISGFVIQRSTDGATFTNVTNQPNTATTYTDTSLVQTQTYYYRMYAVADPIQSLPTAVLGSTP